MARYQFSLPFLLVLTIIFSHEKVNAVGASAFEIFETLTDHVTTVIKEENIQCHNYTAFCNTYLKIPKYNSDWFSNPPHIDAIGGVCQTMLKRLVCQDPHEEICAAKRCPKTYESRM